MHNLLLITQALFSVSLVVLILLQPGEGGWTGFGQGGGENYHTRRGMEKVIYYATMGLLVLFVGNSLALLLL
jgi:protein translocase SecG subunit